MARKVGFGDDQEDQLSTADKAVESFRAKTRAERAERAAKVKSDAARNDFQGGAGTAFFLLFWLTIWTFAIFAAANALFFGGTSVFAQLFLIVWLAGATFAWIFVIRQFFRIVRKIRRR